MAKEFGQGISDIPFEAAEDLSSYQYHFVVLNSSGKIALMDAIGDYPIGVLQNAPESGEAAVVRYAGVSKVVANAAIDEGDFVNAEFNSVTDCGKADATTTAGTLSCGVCIDASSAEDDLCSVLLTPFGALPTAKS